jgi:hypothetical protein
MLNRRELMKSMAVIPVCGILPNLMEAKEKPTQFEVVCLMGAYQKPFPDLEENPVLFTDLEKQIIERIGCDSMYFVTRR